MSTVPFEHVIYGTLTGGNFSPYRSDKSVDVKLPLGIENDNLIVIECSFAKISFQTIDEPLIFKIKFVSVKFDNISSRM